MVFSRLIALTLLCTTGCASSQKFNETVQSMVGQSVHDIEEWLGHPDEISENYAGNKVYVYSSSAWHTNPTRSKSTSTRAVEAGGVVYVPAKTTTTTTGGGSYRLYCDIYLTIDSETERVHRASTKGNDCTSRLTIGEMLNRVSAPFK